MTTNKRWFAAYWDTIVIVLLVILFSVIFDWLSALRYLEHDVSFRPETYHFFGPEFIDILSERFLSFLIRNLLVIISVPFFVYNAARARKGSAANLLQWFGFLALYIYLFSYNIFFYISYYPPYLSLLSILSMLIVAVSLTAFIWKYRSEIKGVEFRFENNVPRKTTIAYLIYKLVGVACILILGVSGITSLDVVHGERMQPAFFAGLIVVFSFVMVVYVWIIIQMLRKKSHGSVFAVMVLTNDKIPDFPTLFLVSYIIPFIILYLAPAFLLKLYVENIVKIKGPMAIP